MGEEGRKVVCVTGGSGYIASWLVKHLLQRGYMVKATVRDLNDPKRTEHLLALDGAKERLQCLVKNQTEKAGDKGRVWYRELERMSQEGPGKVVCVTGGSGYVASWLVKHLLQRGYAVRATVRDPNDPKRTEHLLALDGAKERLQLFKADLLEEGAFDAVVDGCEGVFHTASPVIFSSTDPQTELIDPAVKGTLNVLKSCARVHSVKRVILTSSLAALSVFDGKSDLSEMMIDETFFSDPAFCRQQKLWYPLSKTLAEDAAVNFAKENRLDLVVINPGFVIGPLLQPTLNSTVEMILNLINGAQAYPDAYYRSVDVRDVADVHIKAFEVPSASGRYCLVADVTHFGEIVKIIRHQYPALHLPEKSEESKMYLPKGQVSKEKVKTLGIDFIPLEVTLKDTIESLKEKGFFRESETSA